MKHIQDVRARRTISEEQLYQKLIGSGQRDVQSVIYGEPGTGKSHLIHWLKLRHDSDLEHSRNECARYSLGPILRRII